MTERELTRRQFLRRGGVVAGSALLLAACGPALHQAIHPRQLHLRRSPRQPLRLHQPR